MDTTYAVEVVAYATGKWIPNGMKFRTVEEAKAYGMSLGERWTAVRNWRVVQTTVVVVFLQHQDKGDWLSS